MESSRASGISGGATTPPRTEAKQVILRAKGIDAANAEALERSMAAISRREWERLLPPCIVARQAGEIELPLNVPAESAGAAARITIREEQGRVAESEVNLRDLPQTASEDIDGRTWVRKQARLPAALPLGYHEITVKVGGPERVHPLHRDPGPRLDAARTSAAEAARRGSPSASTACAPRATGAAAISRDLRRHRRLGGRRPAKPASSGSIRCTPSTTAGRSTPAPTCRTASSTRTYLYLDVEAMEDFAAQPAGACAAAIARGSGRDSSSCATRRSWSTSGWRRSSCAS